MNLRPVIVRELLVASRRKETYQRRGLAATLAILITMVVLLMAEYGVIRAAQAGRIAFSILAGAGGLYCFLVACSATVHALVDEKAEGTLGLLYLAGLRSHEIVLGKLFARSWNTLCGLIATAPVPALTFLLGGVAPSEVAVLFLVLLNALFFSAAAGLFASACCKDPQRATWLSLVLLLLPWACYLLVRWAMSQPGPWAAALVAPSFIAASPALSVLSAVTTPLPFSRSAWLLASHAVAHTLGWGLLGLAAWVLSRSWRDDGLATRRGGWRDILFRDLLSRWRAGRRGDTVVRGPLDSELDWMAAPGADRRPSLAVWVATPAILVATAFAIAAYGRTLDLIVAALVVSALGLHVVHGIDAMMQAGRTFTAERHSGALELLLTTPMTEEDLVRSRLLHLKRRLLKPLMLMLAYDGVVLLLLALALPPGRVLPAAGCFVLTLASWMVGLYGGVWGAMWAGLAAPTVARGRAAGNGAAVGATFLIVYQSGSVLMAVTKNGPPLQVTLGICAMFSFIHLVAGISGALSARYKLLEDMRDVAALPTGVAAPKPGLWSLLTGAVPAPRK